MQTSSLSPYQTRAYTSLPYSAISEKRPNSVSISDGAFGDSGKGAVAAKFNRTLNNSHLYSLRFNGGANAGHEIVVEGKKIITHQIPVAIVEEGATAIISRGVVLHPADLLREISHIENALGTSLPGHLVIDERAVLCLNTHRAYEAILNTFNGASGSTGKGIAPAYADYYQRIPLTVKDVMGKNAREMLSSHYRFYQRLMQGFDLSLATMEVPGLGTKDTVGTEQEFIDALLSEREYIRAYISDSVYDLVHDIWYGTTNPFVIEGAQGPGLDPYHGVYPDVTSSRPLIRYITDATYGIIDPAAIELKIGVIKTTYMSSVGIRTLPTSMKGSDASWIQQSFDERGRSTGRLRDIYEISLPLLQYFRKVDGYDFLAATHLDASRIDVPIPVITQYIDRQTRKPMPYLPYQDYLDTITVQTSTYEGWDGEAIKNVHNPKELPTSVLTYLNLLSTQLAPVVIATTGPGIDEYVSWLPTSYLP